MAFCMATPVLAQQASATIEATATVLPAAPVRAQTAWTSSLPALRAAAASRRPADRLATVRIRERAGLRPGTQELVVRVEFAAN